MVATPVQQSQTISVTYGTDGAKIASGRTQPGAANWQVYHANAIYVDVDTSAAGFTQTPVYVTSIGGDSQHYGTDGASSVYSATATGFRIFIKWDTGYKQSNAITPQEANASKWHINWIAIEPASSTTTRPNQLPNLGCENEKQLRSAPNGTTPATQIKFINQTASLVKVYWVKADGQRQLYRDLKPGESFTQSTYVDHVWVVTDKKGACLGIYKGEKDPKDAIIEGNNTALPTPGKYYYIGNKNSGKYLDVEGASTADGGNIQQYSKAAVDQQQWEFQDAGNGYYYIISKKSGKAVGVAGGSTGNTADGANVIQWAKVATADDQKWKLEDAGDGYFYIVNKNSGKVLDVAGSSLVDKGNVIQYQKANGNNQKWKFEAV